MQVRKEIQERESEKIKLRVVTNGKKGEPLFNNSQIHHKTLN